MRTMNTCATCRFWVDVSERAPHLGTCDAVPFLGDVENRQTLELTAAESVTAFAFDILPGLKAGVCRAIDQGVKGYANCGNCCCTAR